MCKKKKYLKPVKAGIFPKEMIEIQKELHTEIAKHFSLPFSIFISDESIRTALELKGRRA